MTTLRVRHLYHRYGLTDVLANVDLDLRAGETLALVGPSGCGKSTLLQIVAGLLTPYSGHVQSDFHATAYVFQDPRLLPWKNAEDNIVLGLKALGQSTRQRRQIARDLGLRLGLAATDLSKYPHELSGGMQSRVALARALAIQPDLLLLDEPFSALDIGLKTRLYELLDTQVRQSATAVLMITHDLTEAVRLADRILMMAPSPGRLVKELVLDAAPATRHDNWVYDTTAALMQMEEVRIGFGLMRGTLISVPASSHQTGCQA